MSRPAAADAFVTPRLTGERLTEGHFADLLRMHADPAQMALLGGVRDEAQTRAYLERNLAHWAEHGFGLWMMRDPATNQIVGRALVRRLSLDGASEVEIGYSLRPDYWGRGLGTEIASACIQFAFDVPALRSVVALTHPENAASRRVLEKVGMSYQRDVRHDNHLHALYRRHAPGAA